MSVRPDRHSICHTRLFNHRVGNNGPFSNNRVHNVGTISQDRLCPNLGLTFQSHICFNLNFRRDFHIHIDIGSIWIDKADTVDHMLLVNPTSHNTLSCSQSHAVINPQTLIKVFERISTDFFTIFTENTNHICDIVFALSIISIDIFEGFKETGIVKDVSPSIDFLDLLLKVRSVLLLNNFQDFSVLVANDTAVAKGIVCFCCQDSRNILVVDMKVNQVFQAFSCNQRSVTSNDQRLTSQIFQNRLCHHNGMPSSQLLSLTNKLSLTCQDLLHQLGLVTDNCHCLFWINGIDTAENVL